MRTYVRRFRTAVLLPGLLGVLVTCDSGLTDINENPNAPRDVSEAYLLAESIRSAVRQTFGADRLMLHHTGIWAQHFVQLQYPEEETGKVFGAMPDGVWRTYYAGALANVQRVIDKSAASQRADYTAIGKIWKAWIFHIVTDLWGDVPYSEALRGADDITPAYDTQASIYASLLADLSSAQEALEDDALGAIDGDLIYDGDLAAWRRFANSLRMRLAMRLSEIDPTTAEAEFAAAYGAGGLRSNADNALLRYPGAPHENPLYENYLTRDDNGVSATMIDTLKSLNDPRLSLYAEPASIDGEYRGHENGRLDLPPGQSLAWFSRIGNFWRADGAATPAVILSYAEVLLLEAEAAARGWIAGDPASLYAAAIRANMDQYDGFGVGPSDAVIDAYLLEPRVAYEPASGMSQIYLQKWIALWMNGSETWAEWRRTGVPQLEMGPDLVVSRIPVRLPYPDTEQTLNSENLTVAVERQGGGLDVVTPVWWDVR